jgi:urocanate hydratase
MMTLLYDRHHQVFVTAGLGGMSGAQPKAAVICGAIGVVAEISRTTHTDTHTHTTRTAGACLALASSY